MGMHRGTVLVFVLWASAAVFGQQAGARPPHPSDQSVLTVRSGVDAVQIDVFVTDAQGMPVRDLTADDFEVLENGKPRPLAAFRAVDIPIERVEDGERPLVEPDVLSNEGPEGRVYMFVLDEVGAIRGCESCEANILRTRRFVRQFIEQHFGPHDVGAVAMLGRALSTDGQDFTSNRRLLLEAVDKYSGGFRGEKPEAGFTPVTEGPCVNDQRRPANMRVAARSQQMSSLRDLAELTSRLPGRHKAMLIFSECFDLDVSDMVDYNGGTWGVGGDDAHAAMAAATRSNLAIYPIDPTGLSLDTADRIPLEALAAFRGVAEITGGFALINSNSFEEAFVRIVRENSSYYMLGFDSAYDRADGRYVRVQIKMKRPGLTVHARDGYVAPTRKEKKQNARGFESTPAPVAVALASPLQTSGVTMRVSAVPARGQGRNASVAVITEIDLSSLGLTAKDGVYSGDLEMRYIATDARRQIYPEVRHTAKVRLDLGPDADATALSGVRVRVGTTLELPPGRYQIRIAAGTAVTAGNVVYDLKVPDFSEAQLAMSGIALVNSAEHGVLALNVTGSSRIAKPTKCWSSNCVTAPPAPTAPNAVVRDADPPRTQAASTLPTTSRVFSWLDEIQVGAEVYDNRQAKKGAGADTIRMTVTLRDATDRVIQLAAEDRVSTTASGNTVLRFALPLRLDEVPPGAYALEVTARSSADDGQAVTQAIPIRVEVPGR